MKVNILVTFVFSDCNLMHPSQWSRKLEPPVRSHIIKLIRWLEARNREQEKTL